MQSKIIYSVTLIAITSLLFSCSKGSNTNPTRTPAEILTSTTWVFFEYKENGTTMTLKAPCEMDDYFNFNTSGQYTKNTGTIKCSPSEPQTFTDSWGLSSDNKQLTITSEVQGELASISETGFTIKRTGANVFEYTYKKK